MKLYRTDDEASITGTVSELHGIRNSLIGFNTPQALELHFDASGNAAPYEKLEATLVVKLGDGPANLYLDESLGLVLTGNKESIDVFSSFFDFEGNSSSGSHVHWDECCDSTYTNAKTISLVVSVA